jgi:hypothetical protein
MEQFLRSTAATVGPLIKILPTLSVKYPNGVRVAFRAVHQQGNIDWDILESLNPEIIQNAVYWVLPVSGGAPPGAPAILPPLTQGSNMVSPTDLRCSAPASNATNQQILEACQRWPDMCASPSR